MFKVFGILLLACISVSIVAKEPIEVAHAKEQKEEKQKQTKQQAKLAKAKLLITKSRELIVDETVSDKKQCFPFC